MVDTTLDHLTKGNNPVNDEYLSRINRINLIDTGILIDYWNKAY